jgi:hypothetical protein
MRKVLLFILLAMAFAPGCWLFEFHSAFPFVKTPEPASTKPDLDPLPDYEQPSNLIRSICAPAQYCGQSIA